ncbi:hypothetical protein H4R24_002933 [Coemansia sp. RSA 988]|nr:hypothetical protein H4R24_002933 [Coemansia sp. RSA 988]
MNKPISSASPSVAAPIDPHMNCYPASAATRKRRRPPYSYTALIAQAILSSEHQQLTLRQIYDSINQMYPQMCQGPDIGWQNTIRHNLSLNQCFKRIPRHQLPISLSSNLRGRGSYWSVDVELMDPSTRKRLDEALSMAESAVPKMYSPRNNNANKKARTGYPHIVSRGSICTNGSNNTSITGMAKLASGKLSRAEAFSDQSSDCSTAISAATPTAYALDNDVQCVSPTIQSSTLYFQSSLNSPISNAPKPSIKQIMHATAHRPLPERYTNVCLPSLPSPLPPPHIAYRGKGFGRTAIRETQLGTPESSNVYSSPITFWEQVRVSATPLPASPYLFGSTISRTRSTVRSTCGEPRNSESIELRHDSGSGSTSTIGSRQTSPHSLSPPSSFAPLQYEANIGVGTDCSKLRINNLIN